VTAQADGAFQSEMRYTAFGETRFSSGPTPTDYQYTGQRHEAEFGLYFYKARWYDPASAHFTQADSIIPDPGYSLAMDRYAYTYKNPLIYTDPSGHIPDSEKQWYFDRTVIIRASYGGKYAYQSLGTILSPNLVITHNHWAINLADTSIQYYFSDGSQISEEPKNIDNTGPELYLPCGWLCLEWKRCKEGQQTKMITTETEFSSKTAPLATQDEIDSINVGTSVEAVFNTSADSQKFALDVISLPVVGIYDGYVVLKDENRVINMGDSGGGVYLDQKLIGNSWAITNYHDSYWDIYFDSSQYIWVPLVSEE
jgi:RHS repeat-associated protein